MRLLAAAAALVAGGLAQADGRPQDPADHHRRSEQRDPCSCGSRVRCALDHQQRAGGQHDANVIAERLGAEDARAIVVVGRELRA